MTMNHTLTTSVDQTDSAGMSTAELDVDIIFRVHGGSPATRTDPAYDAEIEVMTVTHDGEVAPGWAWDIVQDNARIQAEMWEVIAADRADAAEWHAQCRRDDAMMARWGE
jgi:hypothetical protein